MDISRYESELMGSSFSFEYCDRKILDGLHLGDIVELK